MAKKKKNRGWLATTVLQDVGLAALVLGRAPPGGRHGGTRGRGTDQGRATHRTDLRVPPAGVIEGKGEEEETKFKFCVVP